jgi:hypothetical protein
MTVPKSRLNCLPIPDEKHPTDLPPDWREQITRSTRRTGPDQCKVAASDVPFSPRTIAISLIISKNGLIINGQFLKVDCYVISSLWSQSLVRLLGNWQESTSRTPIWRQLAEALRLLILDGASQLETRLPGDVNWRQP